MNKEDAVKSSDVVFRTTPEECAEKIVRAIIKNIKRLMVGLDAKFMDIMSRLSPVLNYIITGLIMEKMSIHKKAMK